MKCFFPIPITIAVLTASPLLAQKSDDRPELPHLLRSIHFGSCIKQAQPIPIFETILADQPELFLMLGDNIYADTHDMSEMKARYGELGSQPLFQRLRKTCPVLATWDDHDFGMNDAGAEYPEKEASRELFLDFWGIRSDSTLPSREGVYDSVVIGPEGKSVQIILLDTRYFRGPLKTGEKRVGGKYYPNPDPSVPMLGDAQWTWLEDQLRKPASLRLIISSIQFVASASGQETWSNLPTERKRMLTLIRTTRAEQVIFASGDRHWSEISMTEEDAPYPIYDITSSALNQVHPRGTPTENTFRVSKTTYHQPNYGMIRINWEDAEVVLEIRDLKGEPVIKQVVPLSDLKPGGKQ